MKFYISGEPYERLCTAFVNIKSFKVIDIDWIMSNYAMGCSETVRDYLISTEIRKMISDSVRNRRCKGIVYLNTGVNANVVNTIRKSLSEITGGDYDDLILLDDYDVPKHEDMYELFNEVVFIPMHKKTKLIECRPIRTAYPSDASTEAGSTPGM